MLRINYISDSVDIVPMMEEGQLLRIAYLLADMSVISGTVYRWMDYERQYGTEDSDRFKIEIIKSHAQMWIPPVSAHEIEAVFINLKQMRAVKHKNGQLIVTLKKAEKMIEKMYADALVPVRSRITPAGYPELLRLWDEYEIEVKPADSVVTTEEKGNIREYIPILREKWEGQDEIYLLPELFMAYLAEKGLKAVPAEEADGKEDVILFRLPSVIHLHDFTATELKFIKREFSDEMALLRKGIEEWSQQLKGEKFSSSLLQVSRKYFSERIEPLCPLLQEKMQHSELLKGKNDFYRGKLYSEIFLGITPAKHIYDFMVWSKLVPEQPMSEFLANPPYGYNGEQPMLFMASKHFKEVNEEPESGDKKSLKL